MYYDDDDGGKYHIIILRLGSCIFKIKNVLQIAFKLQINIFIFHLARTWYKNNHLKARGKGIYDDKVNKQGKDLT